MMPDPPRTAPGYRIHGESHVTRLRFILPARELGFAIEEIAGCWILSTAAHRPVAHYGTGRAALGRPPAQYFGRSTKRT